MCARPLDAGVGRIRPVACSGCWAADSAAFTAAGGGRGPAPRAVRRRPPPGRDHDVAIRAVSGRPASWCGLTAVKVPVPGVPTAPDCGGRGRACRGLPRFWWRWAGGDRGGGCPSRRVRNQPLSAAKRV
jgi:hypothetical protein